MAHGITNMQIITRSWIYWNSSVDHKLDQALFLKSPEPFLVEGGVWAWDYSYTRKRPLLYTSWCINLMHVSKTNSCVDLKLLIASCAHGYRQLVCITCSCVGILSTLDVHNKITTRVQNHNVSGFTFHYLPLTLGNTCIHVLSWWWPNRFYECLWFVFLQPSTANLPWWCAEASLWES